MLLRDVALRKESVDRNSQVVSAELRVFQSLSARRAWIEMWGVFECAACGYVALRKESVDRNVKSMIVRCSLIVSLSARRAWIEI